MNTLRIKPLALALIASFAVSQIALAEVEPSLHEDVSLSPGRTVTPADEAVISSSASRVLSHIARARDALGKKDGEAAKQELKQAETLLGIIQASVPTTLVKSKIWTTDNKQKYENTEEVGATLVPVYAMLDESVDFDRVKLGKTAKAGPKGETPTRVNKETEATDAALYYEELDMPLNATRHFVAAAQAELARNHLTEAAQALRAALDSVDFTSVYLPAPLLAARVNLERAEAHFGGGQLPQAKADVTRAVDQLTEAEQQADPDSKADVKQMLSDAQSLQSRMDKNEPGFKTEMNQLWHRAEAHAERAMAYTKFGWAKLRHTDPLRAALIEAKRYATYADIDANVAGDPAKAKQDLEQANTWLDKASTAVKDGNGKALAVYVKDIRAVMDTLLAGQSKFDKGEMNNLERQLSQAIQRS